MAASIWFLSCLSQGEWLSEILLECDSRNSREMLVSLAGASISAVSPFENGQSVSGGKSRVAGLLAQKMMEMLKVAARNSERFDEFFLLLRDLAVEENVRRFLVNMNGVSNLINLL